MDIIRSIKYHQTAIQQLMERNRSRLDYEGDDVLLDWEYAPIKFHRKAIELLEIGEDIGIDEPADERLLLVDEDYKIVSFNWYEMRYGTSWRLSREAKKKYGREWIPCNESHGGKEWCWLQNQLGLKQITHVWPCCRWLTPYVSNAVLEFRPQFLNYLVIDNYDWSEEFKSSIKVSM